MDVKVLGPGCAKCNKLYDETKKAIEDTGVSANLEKVVDLEEIVSYGVMMTPALVIDGEVKVSGKVPPAKRIAEFLKKD